MDQEKIILSEIEILLKKLDSRQIEAYRSILNELQTQIIKNFHNDDNFKTLVNNFDNSVVESIIKNHLNFITEAINSKDSRIVYNHLLWELQTYHNMGISFKFFKNLFENIINIARTYGNEFNIFIKLYQSIVKNYENIVLLSTNFKSHEKIPEQKEVYDSFMEAILTPDLIKAVKISNKFIKTKKDTEIFWEKIILNALYNIGIKWSNGEISVGQEHAATSICQRVMSIHYDKIIENIEKDLNILVCVSPNELHEIGGRMVADLLELNGYDTIFLGSDSNKKQIIETIKNEGINIVISYIH